MKNRNRYIAITISLVIIGAIFYYFSDIVAYVLIAWVLSMVGQPILAFYKKYFKLGNSGSAGLTLVTFIFLFVGLIWVFVPPILQQTRNLASIDYASLVKTLEEPINSLNNFLVENGLMEGEIVLPSEEEVPSPPKPEIVSPIVYDDELEDKYGFPVVTNFIEIDSILLNNGDTISQTNISLGITIDHENLNGNTLDNSSPTDTLIKKSDTPIVKIQKQIFQAFNPARIPQLFSQLIGFMGNLIIAIMSILFITFFFLKEQGLFTSALQALVPSKYEHQVIDAVEDSTKMLRRYFVGISFQVSIITVFMWIVLNLIGIKSALLIAFFAALINVIPYIGPIIGAIFGVFITISSNLDLPFYEEIMPLILMVLGAFAAMQLLDNFLLQPYIFSNSVSAHPLEIFIVILVGAKLSGIVGMVLAIPVYTVIRVIAKSFLSEFRLVQKITKKMK